MINFSLNEIIEGLKEYYSEKAAELLAKYLLENEQGSSLPIIAILNNEDNNEYEVSIGYDIIRDLYQEFDTEGFTKYLEENENLYGDNILISDDNLVICYME
ncbi:hypothetical protein [Brachyspira hyodysenteriae]|uniref:hypothetical protein n=1 Tax=Brachyspira hyodysenteriae TaxID=159 RepID=UPI00063DD2FC|nr:hypothetical protein [Brachyspira hyodysenteriae]KLI28448.1 hypothetical protein SZ49_12895 [Brachyspira hyodysenteriae]MCZ9920421.1 hypothetical protein [Brachyspira hyodysenteriae]MDA0024052.1 hypothetical protein [Brachyspira hyodysenteriae]MDA0062901.1 hypothetical protein [Brachyspira hyodysenteriae]MDA0062917.1 hypothetical protein [Brachyspira hyodysenteriae]